MQHVPLDPETTGSNPTCHWANFSYFDSKLVRVLNQVPQRGATVPGWIASLETIVVFLLCLILSLIPV